MNAREMWCHAYAEWRIDRLDGLRHDARYYRAKMTTVRREAALERKLEAAQRRIEELESDLDEYQSQEVMSIDRYPYEGDEMDALQREAAGL